MAMLLLLRRLPPRLAPPLRRPRLLLPPPPVNVVPVCAAGGRGHSAAVASAAGVGATSPFSSSGRGRDDGDDGSRRRGRRRPRPTAGLMGFPGIGPGTRTIGRVYVRLQQNKRDPRALFLMAIRFDRLRVRASIHPFHAQVADRARALYIVCMYSIPTSRRRRGQRVVRAVNDDTLVGSGLGAAADAGFCRRAGG